MTLAARDIALQGLAAPFVLSPIAVAIQGLLAYAPIDPPVDPPTEVLQRRPTIVGRGPGTTINWSDYMVKFKSNRHPPVAKSTHTQKTKKRQRMEEELLSLLNYF